MLDFLVGAFLPLILATLMMASAYARAWAKKALP
jgi:hypothetical protein